MVIRCIPYLTTDIFLDVVVKIYSPVFPLPSLGWYLFTVVNHIGHLTRGSNGKAHSITINGNAKFSEIHLGKTLFEFSL